MAAASLALAGPTQRRVQVIREATKEGSVHGGAKRPEDGDGHGPRHERETQVGWSPPWVAVAVVANKRRSGASNGGKGTDSLSHKKMIRTPLYC